MNTPPNTRPVRRYVLIAVGAVLVVLIVSFLWTVALAPHAMDFAGGRSVALPDYKAQNPTGVPPEKMSASLIERGEYLARAADCAACHTAEGAAPFAGGVAFVLPFGTLYSTNITPDKDTGIGNYSDADFLNAVHKGLGRGGKKLYPAMPFASYALMTDEDAVAIKAYLFSLNPVHAPTPQNTLKFPYNHRLLMGIWALLFNPDKRFEPRAERDASWNRGAYLVEAMAHCGECHTPRNLMEALDERKKFGGAVQAGWRAYNISADHAGGVGDWSDAELAQYLKSGHAQGRGTAAGPMGEAVDNSLQFLTPGDISAMVAYLRTVTPVASSDLPPPKTVAAPASYAEGVAANVEPQGKAVYAGACTGCHGWTGVSPVIPAATLTGARSVNDPTAINVVQIILQGGRRHAGDERAEMPSFGHAYSDDEIAALANYVTARFGARPSALTAENIATLRSQN
jgi:mono/diheme cytochrome c family protein